MTSHDTYADLGEAAWRWVLDQVRWDDGPWIPESVPHDGGPPEERDGMHSGIGGLAHVLAEVRADPRRGPTEEQALADGIVDRVRRRTPPRRRRTPTSTASSATSASSAALERRRASRRRRPARRARHRRRLGAAVDGATRGSPRTPASTTSPSARPASCSARSGRTGTASRSASRAGPPRRATSCSPRRSRPRPAPNWPFVPRRFTEAVRAERGDRRCPTGRTGWPASRPRSPSPGAELERPDLVDAARTRCRAPRHPRRHRRRRLRGAPRDPAGPRHGRGHLQLVPRPDRHLAALHRPRARRRRRGGG